MIDLNAEWRAKRQRRWMRENAHRYIRPDAWRYMEAGATRYSRKAGGRYSEPISQYRERDRFAVSDKNVPPDDWRNSGRPCFELRGCSQGAAVHARRGASLLFRLEGLLHKFFDPNQPRVPAGSPDGGQWTSEGGSRGGLNDSRIISDESPDPPPKPGTQFAQNRYVRGQGEMSPGQGARLTAAQARADAAIARVRELDPQWRPTPSLYETAEGQIQSLRAETREAQDRLSELGRSGIGPGPFSKESIPARGPERNFWAEEIRLNNQNGKQFGCHTCGTRDPGTPSGNFVLDHQPPTAWNPLRQPQRLFPQCISCSSRQGNWIFRNGGRR